MPAIMSEITGEVRYHAQMAFPKPSNTRSRVNRAAERWAKWTGGPFERDEMYDAYDVINNWRSCHGYPINTFQMTLRHKLKNVDDHAIVAQRLKRFWSIVAKLRRIPTMKLSNMQDIAGLRAVVHTIRQAKNLRDSYVGADRRFFLHELVNQRDYIEHPKESGYRSIHLVYRYRNRKATEYDGLLLELQIRTRLQHIWATAVETLGTFLNHALKASEGPEEWLNFFSLTSSAFAHIERMPPVPGYEVLSAADTFKATIENAEALNVRDQLQAYTVAAEEIAKSSGDTYHLIVLDPIGKTTSVKSFSRSMIQQANEEYAEIEKKIGDGQDLQAVLVSGGPITELKRAYPNYFLDTHEFLLQLDLLKSRTT